MVEYLNFRGGLAQLAKKKKKRKSEGKSKSFPVKLTEEQFLKRLETLLTAQNATRNGEDAYWDLGPGERPQKTIAEFVHVAKIEGIPLKIVARQKSLALFFLDDETEQEKPEAFRVVRNDSVISNGQR